MRISAAQIRAARGLLDWSREELAQISGLSYNTIRNIESNNLSPREKTAHCLRRAFEGAGLYFMEDDGIRRECVDIKIIKGLNSTETFFDTLLHTIKRKQGEVLGVFKSQEMMVRALGIMKKADLERLGDLACYSESKILLPNTADRLAPLPDCSLCTVPEHYIGPFSYFVFGNRYAIVQEDSIGNFQYVIFNDFDMTVSYRDYFNVLWKMAAPVTFIKEPKEKTDRAQA